MSEICSSFSDGRQICVRNKHTNFGHTGSANPRPPPPAPSLDHARSAAESSGLLLQLGHAAAHLTAPWPPRATSEIDPAGERSLPSRRIVISMLHKAGFSSTKKANATALPARGRATRPAQAGRRYPPRVSRAIRIPEPLRPVPKMPLCGYARLLFAAGLFLDPITPRPPIHVSLLDIGDSSDFLTIMFPLCSILLWLPKNFWSGASGKPGEVSLTV